MADTRFRYHNEATAISIELERLGNRLVTTEAVLTEVGNAFSKQRYRHLTQTTLDTVGELVQFGRATVLTIDNGTWARAWELYHSRHDKDWGHTDCISFVVMEDLSIMKAFTADHHFEQAGFVRLFRP